MPRTKGSKNKVKAAGVDYENLIAAAQKEKEEKLPRPMPALRS